MASSSPIGLRFRSVRFISGEFFWGCRVAGEARRNGRRRAGLKLARNVQPHGRYGGQECLKVALEVGLEIESSGECQRVKYRAICHDCKRLFARFCG